MANYRGHLAGGLALTTVYAAVVMSAPLEQMAEYAHLLNDWQPLAAVFVIGMLFALFPDVDTNSKAQDIFFFIAFPVQALLIWNHYFQAAAYLGLIAMLPIVTHHRGWTHARWAMVVVPLPIIIVPYLANDKVLGISLVYYGAAMVGYFSHLLLDGLIWRRFRVKT